MFDIINLGPLHYVPAVVQNHYHRVRYITFFILSDKYELSDPAVSV